MIGYLYRIVLGKWLSLLYTVLGFYYGKRMYVYRNLPITCSGELMWHIGGYDCYLGCSGVLEWCTDLRDAEDRLSRMKRNGIRFIGLEIGTLVHVATISK